MTADRRLLIAGLAALALVLLLALFAWHEWHVARTAKVETRLAAGQAGAALASGQDAGNAIGNRMDADAETDTITRENDHAIRTASGADAPVDPALRAAGLAGLCRRATYRGDPKCVQHADPR